MDNIPDWVRFLLDVREFECWYNTELKKQNIFSSFIQICEGLWIPSLTTLYLPADSVSSANSLTATLIFIPKSFYLNSLVSFLKKIGLYVHSLFFEPVLTILGLSAIALCEKEIHICLLPSRASQRKMYFLVLVKNLPICLLKVPQHGLDLHLRVMIKYFEFLAITPKQKECLLILTLCRLMVKFCYQY